MLVMLEMHRILVCPWFCLSATTNKYKGTTLHPIFIKFITVYQLMRT